MNGIDASCDFGFADIGQPVRICTDISVLGEDIGRRHVRDLGMKPH